MDAVARIRAHAV